MLPAMLGAYRPVPSLDRAMELGGEGFPLLGRLGASFDMPSVCVVSALEWPEVGGVIKFPLPRDGAGDGPESPPSGLWYRWIGDQSPLLSKETGERGPLRALMTFEVSRQAPVGPR